jgi:prevent-host-death family protein
MTCSDAKNKFGELMDMAQKQPILIEKYRRPFLVVLSYDDYKRMQKQAVNYTVK